MNSPRPHAQLSAPYDWRLSVPNMEKRDGYFSNLRSVVEVTVKLQHEKVRSMQQSVDPSFNRVTASQ